MMATINSSPTKVEPGGSSSSAAAAAGSSANPTVMAVVKHEDADEEIDVDEDTTVAYLQRALDKRRDLAEDGATSADDLPPAPSAPKAL